MPRLKKNVSLNKRNSTRINVTCIVGKEKKKKNCALFCVVLMPPPVILNANAPFLLEIEASNKNGKLLPYSFCSKRYSNLNTHFDQAMKIRIFIIYPNEVPTKIIIFGISDSQLRYFVTGVRLYNSYFKSEHGHFLTKSPAARSRTHKYELVKYPSLKNVNILFIFL